MCFKDLISRGLEFCMIEFRLCAAKKPESAES